jgi:F-type H+-transporting ATPase subunit gamma
LPSIKELNNKLKNYQNTKKITSAMKLVAASKLRRAQEAIERTRPYRAELTGLLADLHGSLAGADVDPSLSPWLAPREIRHVSVVVFTSDKGLCGSFNNGLTRTIEKGFGLRANDLDSERFQEFIGFNEMIAKGVKIKVHFAGKKAYESLKSKLSSDQLGELFHGVTHKPSLSESRKISDRLIADYLDGKTDAIYLAVNQFVSPLTQIPQLQRVFPTAAPATKGKTKSVLFDPDAATVLSALVPQSIRFLMLNALLENAAGEHGARMTAMDNATRNTKEMIEKTTLLRNRVRQANITKELIEIISGAESIKS